MYFQGPLGTRGIQFYLRVYHFRSFGGLRGLATGGLGGVILGSGGFIGSVDIHQLLQFLDVLFVGFLAFRCLHLFNESDKLRLVFLATLVPVLKQLH